MVSKKLKYFSYNYITLISTEQTKPTDQTFEKYLKMFITMIIASMLMGIITVVSRFMVEAKAKWTQEQQQQQQQQQQQEQEQQEQEQEQQEQEQEQEQQQAEKTRYLQKTVHNLQEIVYQLLGGLYNQKTQRSILDYQVEFLFNGPPKKYNKNSSENISPTTRQGDENEACLLRMSKQVKTQKKQIEYMEATIARMEASMVRLVEGLYDSEKQSSVRKLELELLNGDVPESAYAFAGMNDECDVYPTTQQGHRLEERLAKLESASKVHHSDNCDLKPVNTNWCGMQFCCPFDLWHKEKILKTRELQIPTACK